MSPRRLALLGLLVALAGAAAGGAAVLAWRGAGEGGAGAAAGAARPASPDYPGGHPIDASLIGSGRLPMERLPEEVGAALEAHSAEIVKTAEALEAKQARVTGTCAPGSAIRLIGEDGSVTCQRLPRGVASVAAISATARQSATVTAQGTVPGGVGRFQERGEDDFLVAAVPLPDGAQVTGFSYVFWDADPRVDGAAWLYRSDDVVMAGVATSGETATVREATTEKVEHRKVDAARYAYFVYFQVSAEAGANLMPISASVSYRLP